MHLINNAYIVIFSKVFVYSVFLINKVKLDMYKHFGKSVEFKKYLHGICDAGSRFAYFCNLISVTPVK